MATHREAAALSPQDTPHWTRAHEALSRLARERARLDAEEGPWLLHALRSGAHVHMGCGSFWQYIEQLFGYKPRTTQDKLRVAEALEGLPRLNAALTAGALGWSAVRELTRVAVPETEQAWLEAARGKTQRELEALVAHKSPGDAPDAPGAGASARRHVLRFEVDADTFATFREAMQRLERTAGGRLGHDALLLAMARHVLGGPADDGRSSYQISLHVCPECGHGEQVACGERFAIDTAVVEMAECDAQHLGELLAPVVPAKAANENAQPSTRAHDRRLASTRSTRTRPVGARTTPLWAPPPWAARPPHDPRSRAPARAFRPRCVAPSSSAIATAARCRAAPTPSTSTCTTSSDAPTVA